MRKTSMYVIILFLVLSVLLLYASITTDEYDNYSPPSVQPENVPYINPKEFKIGLVEKQPVYKSSNLCDSTTLKPIIPLDVDYEWKMPTNCECTKYLQPP